MKRYWFTLSKALGRIGWMPPPAFPGRIIFPRLDLRRNKFWFPAIGSKQPATFADWFAGLRQAALKPALQPLYC